MKKTLFLLCILVLAAGCATSFKEKRALSKPMVTIAMSKIQEGNIQSALVELRKAEKANPSDPEVYMAYAFAYRQTGAFDKALENADKAISYADKLGLDHPGMKSDAYFMKGTILMLQGGKEEEAIKVFQAAAGDELYATPELAYNNISGLYYILKRYPEAQQAAQQALTKNPHYAPAWRNLALVHLEEGNEDQAIEAMSKAIHEYNGYTEAHYDLAQMLVRRGRTREAIDHLNEVVRLDPTGSYGKKAQERLQDLVH
ncbi:MAG TPA: tetratricopeptide repeat protein [Deltaproteobacteria bacterium]|nr:tetratricopeptide repeat protein [Deltaproteobacteria bacterium]HOI05837.1 tetratricopeptide repeat protein [Deltaproteobacteria bacterium]